MNKVIVVVARTGSQAWHLLNIVDPHDYRSIEEAEEKATRLANAWGEVLPDDEIKVRHVNRKR